MNHIPKGKEVGNITITLFLDENNKEDWKIESNKNFPPELIAKIFRSLADNIEAQDPKHFQIDIERRH